MSTLVGRVASFLVGFGVASAVGAKFVVDEVRKSKNEVVSLTKSLEARVAALEKK